MTDERGSTVWSATYYPFGEMTAGSNNTHGFTGKEFDSEMGLNYFCQRYYDPEIGRFTTLDPQNSPTASPYAYCANCPLVFVDPTGESIERDIVMILGGYIGGTIGGLAFSKIGGGYLGIVTGAFGAIGGAYLGYQAAGWLWDHYNP